MSRFFRATRHALLTWFVDHAILSADEAIDGNLPLARSLTTPRHRRSP
jgi:hypothetical protein